MGPRKQAKDSRKVCERGVPGNFYLARHSYIYIYILNDLILQATNHKGRKVNPVFHPTSVLRRIFRFRAPLGISEDC